MIITGRYPTPHRLRALPQPSAAHGKWLKYAYKSGFWGQDRTKTRGWGHDTASNFARTYNDWVGMSDFNRHFCRPSTLAQKFQTTGNFGAHVDGLQKWGDWNLRWWAPQEACERNPQLFCSPPGLNHIAQSRQPIVVLRKSYLNDFQGSR